MLAVGLAFAGPARAQLTVEVGNGWSLTLAGNVNAFLVHERERAAGTVTSAEALVGAGRHGTSVRTGFLPAFLVFDARGREDSLDLGVHFGLAPQIQTAGGHDNDTTGTQAGARIDLRQAYLIVGGRWGRLLAGREIGLFGRQTFLNDQTLFGIGATGGNFGNPAGPTLGRGGFGALYPNFNAQLTYSASLGAMGGAVGLFDPSGNGAYRTLDFPRVEAELTWTTTRTALWGGALVQPQRADSLDRTAVAAGATVGLKQTIGPLSIVAAGYAGRGIGTTRLFRAATSDGGELRPSYGALLQAGLRPRGTRTTVAASLGLSVLEAADGDPGGTRIENASVTAGLYHQATRSLHLVSEATLAESRQEAARANRSLTVAGGVMLFF